MITPHRAATIQVVKACRLPCVTVWPANLAIADFSMGRLFVWCGVLLLVIVVAGLVVARYRKWMRGGSETGLAQPWSLQELRDLRRDGRISEREFETLKAAIIAEYRSNKNQADAKPDSADRRAE